jgi:hypothetical protein
VAGQRAFTCEGNELQRIAAGSIET